MIKRVFIISVISVFVRKHTFMVFMVLLKYFLLKIIYRIHLTTQYLTFYHKTTKILTYCFINIFIIRFQEIVYCKYHRPTFQSRPLTKIQLILDTSHLWYMEINCIFVYGRDCKGGRWLSSLPYIFCHKYMTITQIKEYFPFYRISLKWHI